MTFRVVFMGSPEFALPSLSALAGHYSVIGVVTQPDRPSGRGRALAPPPVKLLGAQLGLPVIQPARLKETAAMQELQEWAPDLIVVAAFGQILRPAVLDLPRFGCINVHASRLPRWRGAAPIQAAILNGDAETGVTIMRMDPGIDTGPVLAMRSEPILPDDTAASLSARLARLGADLLIQTLPAYLDGRLSPVPQEGGGATYAPMIQKADGELDFTQPAELLARGVRAYQPWPGAFILWRSQPLKVLQARPVPQLAGQPPGVRLVHQGLPAVTTADGLLLLDLVQPAGKKAMRGAAFLQGARDWGDLAP